MTKKLEDLYPSFGTVDMDKGYRISPEAGDVRHILDEDESENWFVRMVNARQCEQNCENHRKIRAQDLT